MIPIIRITFWKRQNYGKSKKISGSQGWGWWKGQKCRQGIFRAVKILCMYFP